MIVNHARYTVLSANTLDGRYGNQDLFPSWTMLTGFVFGSSDRPGVGIEPHYHDCDEFWLFTSGKGEAWMDVETYEIAPNTAVYNPMGVIHRFQWFTPGAAAGLLGRLERQQRLGHLYVEEQGPPEPTVPGFVVPGASNTGPFQHRGPRCPLSELRQVVLASGERVADGHAPTHEYWIAIQGGLQLTIDDTDFEFMPGDLAILRAGTSRTIGSSTGAHVILARE